MTRFADLASFNQSVSQNNLIEQKMIGKTISHYRIVEKLGAGGMGVVYKALDTNLKREVAIKFLPDHVAANDEKRNRFKLEAQAAAALNHPNIATIYNIESHDDQLFIVMEFIRGQELKEHILGNQPLTVEQVFNYARQIAAGLDAAHKKGVIHRDIKSSNIMITEDGQVKIMDFGLAKIRGETKTTNAGAIMGTVAYMSPEQARGKTVDHKADIWGFGVVLYEMCSRNLPFPGDYEQAVIYALLNEAPQPLESKELPAALKNIINSALQKDPGQRQESFSEILRELNVKESETSSARQGMPKRQLAENKLIRKAVWGIGVVVLAAAVFLGTELFSPHAVPSDRKSIAVLPFDNLSENKENLYFSDGVTEDILTHLSQISDLRVISRTSSMRYRNTRKSIRQIGKELNVATILEGSVRRDKNKVRIVAQLIDANTDEHLWAKTYDRELNDIFEIQTDVSRQIAAALKTELSPVEEKRLIHTSTDNLNAYDYYLKGREYYRQYETAANEQAIVLFRKAIDLDPDYTLAYAGLADAYNQRVYRFGFGDAWLDSSEAQVKKALKLDPESAEAYKARGLQLEARRKFRGALDAHLKALQYNPTYSMPNTGYTYLRLGKLDKAHAFLKQAWRINPTFAMASSDMGDVNVLLKKYNQAEEWYRRAEEMQPDFYEGQIFFANLDLLRRRFNAGLDKALAILEVDENHMDAIWTAGFAELLMGNAAQARQYFEKHIAQDISISAAGHFAASTSSSFAFLGYIELLNSNSSKAENLLRQGLAIVNKHLANGSEDAWRYYEIAAIKAVQQDEDTAYDALRKAVEYGWRVTDRARIDPLLQSLHTNKRFSDLLGKVDADISKMRERVDGNGKE